MKKIGLIAFLLVFISVKSQVTMTFTEPKKMETKKFTMVTVYTKSDSIISGYGFVNAINYSSHAVRFIKSKPNTEIIEQEDWSSFYAENLIKVEIEHEAKTLELYPVKSEDSFGLTLFYHKIYENNSVGLYCPPYSIPYINKGKCAYTVLKKGEEKARQVLMKLSDKPKKMPKRAGKFFDDCPMLQQKIEDGEYKKSLKGLITILDFYDLSCEK